MIDLADIKAHLNIPETTTDHDVALQGFCDAVQAPVEDIVGPVALRTITGETANGGSCTVVTQYPIVTVTTLTEYVGTTAYVLTSQPLGSTVNNYGYEVIDAAGGVVLRRGTSGIPMAFMGGRNGVVITYTTGFGVLPANVRLGALELVRHWWQSGQQGGRPGFDSIGGEEGYAPVGSGSVPQFVADLLATTPTSLRRKPGIA